MIPLNNFEPYPFQIKKIKETYKNLIMKVKRNDFDSAVTEASASILNIGSKKVRPFCVQN